MVRPPPSSTRPAPLFPTTTLFRSLIGPAFGRYLLRKAERAHAKDSKTAAPDIPTAIVIHLLSRWRRHKFRRMLALNRRGVVVITDRYPQAEVPGRSEEHTSELQSLMRISYAVFCLKKKQYII